MSIKWYGKMEGLLDITPETLPDYYLVMSGSKSAATSSRGAIRPWLLSYVFLFDATKLVEELRSRGVKIGITTSVRKELWEMAEIYPAHLFSIRSAYSPLRIFRAITMVKPASGWNF